MDADVSFDVVRLCATTDAEKEVLQNRLSPVCCVDWNQVFNQACFHRVEPLVHHTLRQLTPVDASEPPDWALFREEAHAARARGQFGLDELHRVLCRFEQVGVPALTFKGPVLGSMAYGEVGLRSSVDLDLLVRPRDMDTVDSTLRDSGYRPLNADVSRLHRRIRFFLEREHHYAQGPAVFNLDVHTTPVKPSFAYRASFQTLYRRAQSVTVGPRDFMAPSVEDLLLILCYHGAKDRWARLKRICDVNELVRHSSSLDWGALLKGAERLKATRILALGLFMAQRTLETPLPPHVVDFVVKHSAMVRWGNVLVERLPDRVNESQWGSPTERIMYPLAVQDTVRQKARYALVTGVGKLVSLIV
jgi:hypothetical protein